MYNSTQQCGRKTSKMAVDNESTTYMFFYNYLYVFLHLSIDIKWILLYTIGNNTHGQCLFIIKLITNTIDHTWQPKVLLFPGNEQSFHLCSFCERFLTHNMISLVRTFSVFPWIIYHQPLPWIKLSQWRIIQYLEHLPGAYKSTLMNFMCSQKITSIQFCSRITIIFSSYVHL